MKKFSLLFLLIITTYLRGNDELNLEALKEWLATKRAITLDERGGSLSLSGDIRVEYQTASEQLNGVNNIGVRSLHPLIATNQYDVEFNGMLDYRTDTSWASTKLKYDNDAGILSGSLNSILIERAFFGLRIKETDASSTELEFGRRFIGYTFDSRFQFGSLMDGILLKYNRTTQQYGDFYFFFSPYIVNELTNHVSFVGEAGVLNAFNTGFYFKYSLIDWNTKSFEAERLNRMYSFINSQVIVGYRFNNPFFNAVTILYGAFLVNGAAKRYEILNNRKDNMAAYIGISMGEIRKKNDWSLDLNFQVVQPQAIPAFDFSGIGILNPDNIGLYTILPNGSGGFVVKENAVSNGNFYGFRLYFLYALEDTVSISQSISFSRPLMDLEKKFNYQEYKLVFIYAW